MCRSLDTVNWFERWLKNSNNGSAHWLMTNVPQRGKCFISSRLLSLLYLQGYSDIESLHNTVMLRRLSGQPTSSAASLGRHIFVFRIRIFRISHSAGFCVRNPTSPTTTRLVTLAVVIFHVFQLYINRCLCNGDMTEACFLWLCLNRIHAGETRAA